MQEDTKRTSKLSKGAAIALGVFLFALAFRLIGIGWGLKNDLHNASYHPDEPVIFFFSREIEPGRGKFFPSANFSIEHFYSYGTLYLTLLRIASDVTLTYTGDEEMKPPNPSHDRTDWDWISRCTIAGRLITAFAGAGTALFVCLMMSRIFGLASGALAGLFIAVAPAHVLHSRFQTVDVTAAFFLTVSLYFAIRLVQPKDVTSLEPEEAPTSPIWKDALWCGVFAGLSAGTKYTGILALLSLAAALLIYRRKGWGAALGLGTVAAFLVFLITTPGALFDTRHFLADIESEMIHTATGHGLVFSGTPNGFIYEFGVNLVFGIGPLLAVLGLLGLLWAAIKKHRWAWVLLAFFIPYYFLIGRSEVKFVRYTFPLYPALACGFGYVMVAAHRRSSWTRIGVGLGILGLGGVPFGGLATAASLTRTMVEEDPRDAAAKYLKGVSGHVGLTAMPWFWTPPLFTSSANPPSFLPVARFGAMREAQTPIDLVVTDHDAVPEWSTLLITQLHPEHITFSSFQYYPIERLRGTKGWPPDVQPAVDVSTEFLRLLDQQYEPEQMFGTVVLGGDHPEMLPEDLLYTAPVVWVFKRKP